MTYTFKLSRRIARLRASISASVLLALIACNSTDSLEPETSGPASTATTQPAPSLATTAFAGGIPIGFFAQPNEEFGSRYNGAMRNDDVSSLKGNLADIKSRGGKIVMNFSGSMAYYKNADGTFNLTKWKQRVDRYRGLDIDDYISDGTIIGHYLIDEPNDPANWSGEPVPASVVDEMARYSKQIWPSLPTIARVEPDYFNNPQYLDAAWAQYLARRGNVNDYIRKVVSDAQSRGLGLVVGLNPLKGGDPTLTPMTASEVQTFGSALLSSTYPCAFISWTWDDRYLATTGMGSAMDALRRLAQNRGVRSCRAGSTTGPAPTPPPPAPSPTPVVSNALPLGLLQTPIEEYTGRWNGAVYRANPADLIGRLGRAQNNHMNVVAMLAVSSRVRNADGTFSLAKWKMEVDRYRGLSLGQYISSRTFYLHHLVDQPNCSSCWGGKAISWATLEEMAKYSKSIWPSLPTVALAAPSDLASASFRWTYLDAGWAQYTMRRGSLSAYLSTQVAQAKAEGLGLVTGLDLLSGGSAGAPMTASQVKEFGTILAKEPNTCAVASRRYDSAYLGRTGVRDALDAVAAIAKSRIAASCVVN